MQKNNIISIVLSMAIIATTFYFVTKSSDVSSSNVGIAPSQNIEIRDGIQYVTITAKGGYFPKLSFVKPDIPTKLIIKTNGTYDCSASLVIRSVGFQKVLEPSQEEIIDLGIPKVGDEIKGVCSMGMYSFQIRTN